MNNKRHPLKKHSLKFLNKTSSIVFYFEHNRKGKSCINANRLLTSEHD